MQERYKILTETFEESKLLTNEPMSGHTSFKIGGNTDVLILTTNKLEVLTALKLCRENKFPFYVMGNGSNILVRDGGFRGVIIKVSKEFGEIKLTGDNTIYCEAGALLSSLSAFALNNLLSGLEFASGIPGTVGGAVYMNAGAYDGEMKDVVCFADVLDNKLNEVKLTNEQLCFGYRTSAVEKGGYIVLGAELTLRPGSANEIKAKMDNFNAQRREKQPLDLPSAGSTFKRPKGYFAGKLIADSGLRGYRIGGASVSDKHCGFIVNSGGARAEDVLRLIEHVQEIVYEKFNILLKPEIRIIGE